ncbi:hypothetical protein [uncultured Delftia sp.]|jgi:hypothetical protein|uniref:hypothetical protein n=1 Tax=uncultured Delftia sp. TaxID=191464 RepID=UPI0025998C5F|nr:hypothetical protein [uncultured Delftia sp.]
MSTLKSIKDFKKAGAIVSTEPVLRHIEWTSKNPDTGEEVQFDADVYFLRPSAGKWQDIHARNGEDGRKQLVSTAISECMLLKNEQGAFEQLSYEDAYNLDTPLQNAVWNALAPLAGAVQKNSQPTTSSSANSSSTASEAEGSKTPGAT